MSTDRMWQTNSVNSEATEQLASSIGRKCRGGEVFALSSDLGGGKTTFTRGLVRGIGSPDVVGSPTFTISKLYESANLTVYHFDFYRLSDPGLMAHELHDALKDPKGVVVVEWGNIVDDVLPEERVNITLNRTGDETRTLMCTYPGHFAYLFENLQG